MSVFETPDSRTQAEKRICVNAHTKKFGNGEVSEFVDIDGNAENENDR
jgi:hypothetical protein